MKQTGLFYNDQQLQQKIRLLYGRWKKLMDESKLFLALSVKQKNPGKSNLIYRDFSNINSFLNHPKINQVDHMLNQFVIAFGIVIVFQVSAENAGDTLPHRS